MTMDSKRPPCDDGAINFHSGSQMLLPCPHLSWTCLPHPHPDSYVSTDLVPPRIPPARIRVARNIADIYQVLDITFLVLLNGLDRDLLEVLVLPTPPEFLSWREVLDSSYTGSCPASLHLGASFLLSSKSQAAPLTSVVYSFFHSPQHGRSDWQLNKQRGLGWQQGGQWWSKQSGQRCHVRREEACN